MTHFRVLLLTAQEKLAEEHKDVPRPGYGWTRRMKEGRPLVYMEVNYCPWEDEDCKPYQAWLELKGAHEDDREAKALRDEERAARALREVGA